MAEAVVDERAPMPTRFYCHMCSMEINIPNTDYTCPHCAGGFVEELPALPPAGSSGSNQQMGSADGAAIADFNRISDFDAIRGEIATLLMSHNGPSVEIAIEPGNRRSNVLIGNDSGTSGGSGGGGGGGIGSSRYRVRPQNFERIDNVLEFLQSIASGDTDASFGNPPMFFMGNPGDYAWGREGIDTIVTQLLNQMETSGPPPLAKEKIAEIPKVEVNTEEVERKLQCSVCWEDFRLHEIVRRLPCSHIYHESCIVPWLDLHGTCPICRKSLADEEAEGGIAANGGSGNPVANVEQSTGCPVHRIASSVGGGGATTSGAASQRSTTSTAAGASASGSNGGFTTNSTTSQTQRNDIFAFDDSNVDLD